MKLFTIKVRWTVGLRNCYLQVNVPLLANWESRERERSHFSVHVAKLTIKKTLFQSNTNISLFKSHLTSLWKAWIDHFFPVENPTDLNCIKASKAESESWEYKKKISSRKTLFLIIDIVFSSIKELFLQNIRLFTLSHFDTNLK